MQNGKDQIIVTNDEWQNILDSAALVCQGQKNLQVFNPWQTWRSKALTVTAQHSVGVSICCMGTSSCSEHWWGWVVGSVPWTLLFHRLLTYIICTFHLTFFKPPKLPVRVSECRGLPLPLYPFATVRRASPASRPDQLKKIPRRIKQELEESRRVTGYKLLHKQDLCSASGHAVRRRHFTLWLLRTVILPGTWFPPTTTAAHVEGVGICYLPLSSGSRRGDNVFRLYKVFPSSAVML